MPNTMLDAIEVFSTCPPSSGAAGGTYLHHVAEVARWSDRVGCRGILGYSDNSPVDPWLVSQTILAHTAALCPLVAVQPGYMHPHAAAKRGTSFAYLYPRRI